MKNWKKLLKGTLLKEYVIRSILWTGSKSLI